MDPPSQYNFQHQKRGYALIICNEEFEIEELGSRPGQLDGLEKFKNTLEKEFHFEVDLKVDQTALETQTLMDTGKLPLPVLVLPGSSLVVSPVNK